VRERWARERGLTGGRWFCPTYELASTHILKPPAREHRNLDTAAEHRRLTRALS
jgi:hypothetical protein